ncbi:MAG: hypothetical protein ABJO67_14290, partial [Pseudoruegeria sp.]
RVENIMRFGDDLVANQERQSDADSIFINAERSKRQPRFRYLGTSLDRQQPLKNVILSANN